MDETQNSFEGWAIIEMMGHRKEIGYVTAEHYGAAALFRVDSPEFIDREHELERPEWINGSLVPKGSKVKRQAIPARSVLIGPGSVYALNPCTEETAKKAIERSIDRPLILLSIPDGAKLISASEISEEQDDPELDRCTTCGEAPEYCECI